MKKSIFLTILSLFVCLTLCATKPDSIYTRHGNTFVTVKMQKSSPAIPTKYTWRDSEGKDYTIYLTATSCYIIKISKKTGKEYKQYLPKEVRAEIAKELMDSKSK